jgi:hypothetical protein
MQKGTRNTGKKLMSYSLMSKPETNKKRKQIAKEEAAIRQVINAWQPIGFPMPEDEYDCLVHHLLSVLNSGGSQQDVAAKIKNDIENHFGLSPFPEKEISIVAERVWAHWQNVITNK